MKLLGVVTILLGVCTITAGNPINSVVYLVGGFCSCSGIFIYLGYNIIGGIYIIVYVGSIAILFLFVLGMMDLRVFQGEKIVALGLLGTIIILGGCMNWIGEGTTVEMIFSPRGDSLINSKNSLLHSLAFLISTDGSLLLILASFILLMVMIAVLSIMGKRVDSE